ncbi:MAG: hypothetical protein JSW06_02565 [Thermoplasmatales archaeon]|nr:MAG: hypothetical protein JSW06_02565 [Thermoplasmatales archaeon]
MKNNMLKKSMIFGIIIILFLGASVPASIIVDNTEELNIKNCIINNYLGLIPISNNEIIFA